MPRIGKFSRKYGLFLSDASDEEIVSVSKELMNGLSHEIKSVNSTALALLGMSVVSLILTIMLIAGLGDIASSSLKSVIFLTRLLPLALLCMSAFIAGRVVGKAADASSISTLLWRNIRETVDSDKAYEQIQAIKVAGMLMNTSKMLVKMAALMVALAIGVLGIGYILELLLASSYL